MLHITNGHSVVSTFEEMALEGKYLAWRDVLHEGPVPRTATLAELSAIRARFIAGCGWETAEEARAEFAARDAVLEASSSEDEVVLWFEHDLYDQLQLLQVLDWFHARQPLPHKLSLLHPEGHLGAMPAEVLNAVYPLRQPVHPTQLQLATEAWAAFTGPDPMAMLAYIDRERLPLPYLPANFRRLLEEYPSTRNGLSRSQQEVLQAVAAGNATFDEIYTAVSAMEDPVFLGDWPVQRRLAELAPLALETDGERYRMTPLGRALLAGQADWLETRGGIDVWIGGVHLEGSAPWRWDAEANTLRVVG